MTTWHLRPNQDFFKLNKMTSYIPLDARLVFSQLNNIQLVIEGRLMMTSHNISNGVCFHTLCIDKRRGSIMLFMRFLSQGKWLSKFKLKWEYTWECQYMLFPCCSKSYFRLYRFQHCHWFLVKSKLMLSYNLLKNALFID